MEDVTGARHRVLIPGKTFLVGEYLALAGGPSIIVNTSPTFEFSWETEATDDSSRAIRHPFHVNSPAGKCLEQASRMNHLNNKPHSIQFKDPFDGKGGMGASTAEFAGAWVFRRWLENSDEWNFQGSLVSSLEDHRERIAPNWKSERFGSQRFRDLLDDYRKTTEVGSGADLVSQFTGGAAVWDGRIDEMRRFAWPFSDLALTLVLTGKKMATHSHLSGLGALDESVQGEMLTWVEEAIQAFALADGDRLIASVRGFGKVLDESGRLADHSRSLLEELADCSGVRAAKGCGAMGSDVLAILHDRSAAAMVTEFIEANDLKCAGRDTDIVQDGVRLEAIGAEASV